tara:strand:+ start:253 stop:552 length:300 start_codon:yes stop_codon:yes gene_type:complete
MSYKTVTIKKRFNGLAEIRSHVLEHVRQKGLGLRFVYIGGDNRETMTVPHGELGRGFTTARGIVSRFPPYDTFDLVSFKWDDATDPHDQMELDLGDAMP